MTSTTHLPEPLTRPSPLMERESKKMGFVCPLFTRWCLAVCLVLNFFYHKNKKNQTAYKFFGVKRSDTSWLFFIMTSLQSGTQPTSDSLASIDKQKSNVGGYLDLLWSLTCLLTCSKKYPYLLDKVPCQLMPSLYADKDRVIDCIWLWSSSTGSR